MINHPEGLPQQQWTVVGCWRETLERYADYYDAPSARAAEDLARMAASEAGGTLWVCRVLPGEPTTADAYTAFVDPQDPRNLDAEGLELDLTGLEESDWTVFGIAVPAGTDDDDIRQTGERYGDTVTALSAGAAEDVARDRLKDRGGTLMVCAVFSGKVTAADRYASFVDPDIRAT